MYENIGEKIKGLAKAMAIVGVIEGIAGGSAIMIIEDDLIWLGLLVMLISPFAAWASSWLIYGFGELIDKTSKIEKNTRKYADNSVSSVVEENTPSTSSNHENENNAMPITSPNLQLKYRCMNIELVGKKSHGMCVVCKKANVDLEKSKIYTLIGTRNLDICQNCYQHFYDAATDK